MDALSVEQLAGRFGFTADEVGLNRAGQFSERQHQQFRYQSIGYLVRGLAFLVLSIILALTLYPQLDTNWQKGIFALSCILLLIAGGALLAAARRAFFPTIHTITGPLSRTGSPKQPTITAGDQSLRIPYRRWKRLPIFFPGEYRVYYAHYHMLSIEPVISRRIPKYAAPAAGLRAGNGRSAPG